MQIFFKLKKLFFSGVFLVFVSIGCAQTQPGIEESKNNASSLQSPFHTMYNHLNNLRQDNYFPEQAALSLYPSPNISVSNRVKLAIQLNQIYRGNGLYFDEEVVPREQYYQDTSKKAFVYTPFKEFPEIYLFAINGRWYYSESTLNAIPSIHKKTFPFQTDTLFEYLEEKTGDFQFLGLSTSQLIGLVFLFVGPFILFYVFRFLIKKIIKIFLGKIGLKYKHKNRIDRFAHTFSFFMIFLLIRAIIPVFQFPAIISHYVLYAVEIAIPVSGLLVALGLINLLMSYLEKTFQKNNNKWFEQLIPFMQAALQTIAVLVSIIYILEALDLNVTALLAGISIGGLAFALAAQDTIKNLFGSLMIFIDRPFKVGDWITTEGIDGMVEEIGIRSTRVRSFYDSVLYVPNGRMADSTIDNLGMRIYRRYRSTLGVTYDTPAPVMKVFLKGLRQIIRNHPQTRKDFFGISFFEYGASSLNILLNVFLIAPDLENEWNIREQINLEILNLANELGVRFAFPTQTVHIEELPGQESLSPQYEDLDEGKLNAKLEAYFDKNGKAS